MKFPALPLRASYLHLNNPKRRNALSLAVLRDLRRQLTANNTSPTGHLRILPPFKSEILDKLEKGGSEYSWLLDGDAWRQERGKLPKVLVLRSEGPVFSSGHDLGEVRTLGQAEVKETFALCAEVMTLIRRSPAPIVAVVQGLATAAGAQLALSTDFPIALASTLFRLPGATIGLPCTSPSTAFSRRLNPAQIYRMLATAEPLRADELGGAVDVVGTPANLNQSDNKNIEEDGRAALEARVEEIVMQLAQRSGGQSTALGKWAYHTQLGITGSSTIHGGDGYEDAVSWAGRVMALHARSEDAREGIAAFFEKRQAVWHT